MIDDVMSGWLYARSGSLGDLQVADLTLVLPTKSGLRVYAQIMLTALSQGGDLKKSVGGMVATRVVRGTVMGKNGLEFVDIPADPTSNSAYFDNCLAVDFRLAAELAEGYANANVWYHAKPAKKPLDIVRLHLDVVDRKTGGWKYSRTFAGPRKRLPSAEQAAQMAIGSAAMLHRVPASALAIAKPSQQSPVAKRESKSQRSILAAGIRKI